MKQFERRVFIFDSSLADEKYFRAAIARWLANQGSDRIEFREFLWDLTFERSESGYTIKYLHFNERTQKLYLDWFFVQWAKRASDEIEETLNKTKP